MNMMKQLKQIGSLWKCSVALLLLIACGENRQPAAPSQVSALYGSEQQAQKTIVEYELPAPLTDRPELIIRRTGYTTSYNATTKQPNWVAWHLTRNRMRGSATRAESAFMEDVSVPEPRATLNDYYNRGYDRGHMCPAADNKWDKTAMDESFLLTNVCPQNHGLNKYEWNDVEKLCREWANRYGAIDVVCGPVFRNGQQQKTIGRNKVWVPDAFFKVVLCRKDTPKAIGFVYENVGRKMEMKDHVFTVDAIEELTGIDFFPALKDDVEQQVEASSNLADW